MRQFTVAYDADNAKATVLPVDKDIPDGSTPIGYFDDRDLALPIDKLDLRERLKDKNGTADPVLLHHVETLLVRHGVEDLTEVKVTVSKDVKTAQKEAIEAAEHEQEQGEQTGRVDPAAQNTTAETARTEPKLK